MIRFLQRWWWKRQRAIDLELLWPICISEAATVEDARRAFFVHAMTSPAWVRVYEDRLYYEIQKLT